MHLTTGVGQPQRATTLAPSHLLIPSQASRNDLEPHSAFDDAESSVSRDDRQTHSVLVRSVTSTPPPAGCPHPLVNFPTFVVGERLPCHLHIPPYSMNALGVDIASFSAIPSESEVLLLPGLPLVNRPGQNPESDLWTFEIETAGAFGEEESPRAMIDYVHPGTFACYWYPRMHSPFPAICKWSLSICVLAGTGCRHHVVHSGMRGGCGCGKKKISPVLLFICLIWCVCHCPQTTPF